MPPASTPQGSAMLTHCADTGHRLIRLAWTPLCSVCSPRNLCLASGGNGLEFFYVRLVAHGFYDPPAMQVRCFELSQLSLKFERHLDSEIVDFEVGIYTPPLSRTP